MAKKFLHNFKEKSDRYIPFVLNCLVIIFCMCTFFPLGSVVNYFHGECVLYAEPAIKSLEISTSKVTKINLDIKSSVWGGTSSCSYTTYTPVVVAIYIFIWLWFRLQLRTSVYDDGYVITAMVIGGIINIILWFALFITSCILVVGTSHFCRNIETSLQESVGQIAVVASLLTNTDSIGFKCSDAQNMLWSVYTDGKTHSFYTYLQLAQASSWITVGILGLQIAYNIRKACKMLAESDDEVDGNSSMCSSDDDSIHEISYRNHAYNHETGSIRFHTNFRKESVQSNEQFLLPL